jgi:hypothetical protein
MEMKGADEPVTPYRKYKEFTEERARKLYEELMLQFLKSGASEIDADRKAKAIIRKQCSIRGMPFWPWA